MDWLGSCVLFTGSEWTDDGAGNCNTVERMMLRLLCDPWYKWLVVEIYVDASARQCANWYGVHLRLPWPWCGSLPFLSNSMDPARSNWSPGQACRPSRNILYHSTTQASLFAKSVVQFKVNTKATPSLTSVRSLNFIAPTWHSIDLTKYKTNKGKHINFHKNYHTEISATMTFQPIKYIKKGIENRSTTSAKRRAGLLKQGPTGRFHTLRSSKV